MDSVSFVVRFFQAGLLSDIFRDGTSIEFVTISDREIRITGGNGLLTTWHL
jgi:hypothetical protein